jgi:hypothetical protein
MLWEREFAVSSHDGHDVVSARARAREQRQQGARCQSARLDVRFYLVRSPSFAFCFQTLLRLLPVIIVQKREIKKSQVTWDGKTRSEVGILGLPIQRVHSPLRLPCYSPREEG